MQILTLCGLLLMMGAAATNCFSVALVPSQQNGTEIKTEYDGFENNNSVLLYLLSSCWLGWEIQLVTRCRCKESAKSSGKE